SRQIDAGGAAGELDQVVAAGGHVDARQVDLVRRIAEEARRRGRVLDRLAAEIDRRSAAVEELDEVVLVRRAAISAATVDLADDEVGRDDERRCRSALPVLTGSRATGCQDDAGERRCR